MFKERNTKPKGKAETTKSRLHTRSKHRKRYNFNELINSHPNLKQFVAENIHGDESIDFFNPDAVKALNTALLKHYYDVQEWIIPTDYLVPPIPGRADYIHHAADLLAKKVENSSDSIPVGQHVKCLDIGVGANIIYPLIGNKEYGWSFVGTEADKNAYEAALSNIESNPHLKEFIRLRFQKHAKDIFFGAIKKGERFDITICNPPFHASLKDAQSGTIRKLRNLKKEHITKPQLNFGGQTTELWTEGGEERFIRDMIIQSKTYRDSVLWFTTLVAKQTHLKGIYNSLKRIHATQVKTIPMGQGNKSSRIVAWSFLSKADHQKWAEDYWKEYRKVESSLD